MESVLLDAAGHRRSPATMPGYHQGRPPRNKGLRYPADPPTIEEIVAVMRAADDRADGARLRALIVILWRAGLRIGEALALAETDLDPGRGAVLVRRGKAAVAARSGWTAGAGSSSNRGSRSGRRCRSGSCCASSTVRRLVAIGSNPPRGSTCDEPPRRLAYAAASRRTSSGTRMRSKWLTRAFRSWSFSASWGTRTSGSHRSTYRASTARRSSTRSIVVQRR